MGRPFPALAVRNEGEADCQEQCAPPEPLGSRLTLAFGAPLVFGGSALLAVGQVAVRPTQQEDSTGAIRCSSRS